MMTADKYILIVVTIFILMNLYVGDYLDAGLWAALVVFEVCYSMVCRRRKKKEQQTKESPQEKQITKEYKQNNCIE